VLWVERFLEIGDLTTKFIEPVEKSLSGFVTYVTPSLDNNEDVGAFVAGATGIIQKLTKFFF
jgi:hypothetical protein